MKKFFYPFHLVTNRPWPLMGAVSLIITIIGILKYINEFNNTLLLIGFSILILVVFQWWRDVIRERTYQGIHCLKVIFGLRLGIFLFILSEFIFFVSFFWTYFHIYLSPGREIGCCWPSYSLIIFNPYNIPLLNTLLLLSSGFTITWCHYRIFNNDYKSRINLIILTIFLGLIFIVFQYLEYNEAFFSISDSVYGSIFFLATGFHGLHILIGVVFIIISLIRLLINQFSKIHHLGFEMASWYWHFVDVIWLFLYLFIYWIAY